MSKTILIVDDSMPLRKVVSISLKGAGYEVVEAEHGQDALDKLKSNKVNLIVSDINMPVMDGIQFVTELKKLPEYKFTPVIMLTTESEVEKKEQAKAAGARAWMNKPFKPDQMLNAVEKLMM